MSAAGPRIEFEPVAPRHYALLRSWLEAPHVAEWWGDAETEFGHIVDMVEGRDTTEPYIFHVDGEPTGYIQVWFIGHHQNETWIADNPWLAELPSETVGVDLTIGVADRLSRGIGSLVLRQFADRLVAAGHAPIIIDPDPSNARAVAAYTRAGFRPVPRLLGRSGDSLIMQFEPDAAT